MKEVKKITAWKWAVITPQGIFNGELLGEIEPGETDEHAMQTVSDIVKEYLTTKQNVPTILACFISDSALHIDAPGTTLTSLDVEIDFPH